MEKPTKMMFNEFRERIRVGVVAGIYDKDVVLNRLAESGWHTTQDVPEDQRKPMIDYLESASRAAVFSP